MTTSKIHNTSKKTILLRFFGSMNLAITLLVALAIASIIGTVLQQDQPYSNYVLKFGPFWFEVYKELGLLSVYSSLWFLIILGFLVLSVSVCIYRNVPRMFYEMSDFRMKVTERSLRSHRHQIEWNVKASADECMDVSRRLMAHQGFRLKEKNDGEYHLLSAIKGAGSRWGYLLTHIAIVVICIGGLMDGDILLKFAEWRGTLQIEKRDITASQVPSISRLDSSNPSFRGNVTIPEGGKANVAFLGYKDGYLVQELPFTIKIEDFRIEHYVSGQPKSFETDLVIIDDELSEPLKQTISVNHPLSYEGITIYQASFGDGGSKLELKAWPFIGNNKNVEVRTILGIVDQSKELTTIKGKMSLEINDFRRFNIRPSPIEGKKFHDIGPSFQFKLRTETGEAREYLNYMNPIVTEGRSFFMSGMRSSPAEPFQYLHLPVDSDGGLDRFMEFYAYLRDKDKLTALAQKTSNAYTEQPNSVKNTNIELAGLMNSLVGIYLKGGLNKVLNAIEERVPDEKKEEVTSTYMKILRHFLGSVFMEVLKSEGISVEKGMSESDALFFMEASSAIGALERYGSPLFFQLEDFEHKEASGLQLTRSPGINLVYPGCAMLALGVFLMFYMPQRRLWVQVKKVEDRVLVLLSGVAVRNRFDFSVEFKIISDKLDEVFAPHIR